MQLETQRKPPTYRLVGIQPGQSSTQDNNAVQNEKPTDPNLPKTQPEINKLQKGERT